LAPAARLLPQELANTNEDAFAPVTLILVIDNGDPPVLVIVTDCDALVVSMAWSGNERLVEVSDTAGAVAPVPLSAMLCGDPLALSVMVTAAESGPVVVGVKWPWIEQLAPAARLLPQELAKTNEDASVPVTAMLVIDIGDTLVLVNVTDCERLVVSTSWFP